MYIPSSTQLALSVLGALLSPDEETFTTWLKVADRDACLALDRFPSEAATVNLMSCRRRIHSPRRWEITTNFDGFTMLRRAGSDFCLSARDYDEDLPYTFDGTTIQLETCPETLSQAATTPGLLWRIVPHLNVSEASEATIQLLLDVEGPPVWLFASDEGPKLALARDSADERIARAQWTLSAPHAHHP